ncbi:hypothetical protein R1flu_008666 [Riccia fluitans]|uniref:Uncharacterized protein n=1 Tax=Riccia fluitans TaxID=41844 RepID=A0ABD1YCN1_9MARC
MLRKFFLLIGFLLGSLPSIRSPKRYKLVDQALPELRTDEPRLETCKAARTVLEGEEGSSVQVRIQDSDTMLRDAFIEFYCGLTLLMGYRASHCYSL